MKNIEKTIDKYIGEKTLQSTGHGKPKGNYTKDLEVYAKDLAGMEEEERDDAWGDTIEGLANMYDMKTKQVEKDLKKKLRSMGIKESTEYKMFQNKAVKHLYNIKKELISLKKISDDTKNDKDFDKGDWNKVNSFIENTLSQIDNLDKNVL